MLFAFLPSVLHEDERIGPSIDKVQYKKEFDLDPKLLQMAGCYAAVSELEQFMVTRAEEFSFTGGFESADHFVPDWNPEKSEVLKGEKPFDWAYLIGSTSAEGKKLRGVSDATDMVADLMFAFLVEQSSVRLLRSLSSNHKTFSQPIQYAPSNPSNSSTLIRVTPRHYGRYFGSFGLSRVYVGESRLRRWASFAVAESFATDLITANEEFSEAQARDLSARSLRDWGWDSKSVFSRLAGPILSHLDSRIRSLDTFDAFRSFVHDLTVNSLIDRRAPAILDQAKLEIVEAMQGESQRNSLAAKVETILLHHGIDGSCCFLDQMEDDLRCAMRQAQDARDATTFEDLTADAKEWWSLQSNWLLWMGHSTPKKPFEVKRPFTKAVELVHDLASLRNLDDTGALPKLVTAKVEEHYIRRFKAEFIDPGISEAWYTNLLSQSNLGQAEGLIDQTRAALLKVAINILSSFEAVLEKALREVLAIRKVLAKKSSEAVTGTVLQDYIGLLLEREGRASGTKDGFRPERMSEETPKEQGRNRFVGGVFQSKDRLRSPNPDPTVMADLVKQAAANASGQDVKWLWEIRDKPVERVQEELLLLLSDPDQELTQFKEEPSLKTYLVEQGASRGQTLAGHLRHAFDHQHPFILYDLANDPTVNPPSTTSYVLAPHELLSEIREALKSVSSASNANVEGYDGNEVMMVQVLDGFPLPSITELWTYAVEEARFKYPGMIWTRKTRPPYRLMSTGSRHEVRKFVVAGILLGAIEYTDKDPYSAGYRFSLELSHRPGAPGEVVVGDSIQSVVEFFEKNRESSVFDQSSGRNPSRYEKPFIRLQTEVQRRLDREDVQRQFGHMLTFLQTHYFTQKHVDDKYIWDFLNSEWNHRLRQRFEDNGERIAQFNRDCNALKDWMHAYCRVVPIHKGLNLEHPNEDMIPALFPRQPKTEEAKKAQLDTLFWFNTTFGKNGRTFADVKRGPYRCAMSSDGSKKSFVELNPPSAEDPSQVPEDIENLAWPVDRDSKTHPIASAPRRAPQMAVEEPDNF